VCVQYDTQKGTCECEDQCTEAGCSCVKMSLSGAVRASTPCVWSDGGGDRPARGGLRVQHHVRMQRRLRQPQDPARPPAQDRGALPPCPGCCTAAERCGQVFRTTQKEWGVRAAEAIPAGSFVCEYAGELIDEKEERRRYPRCGRSQCRAARLTAGPARGCRCTRRRSSTPSARRTPRWRPSCPARTCLTSAARSGPSVARVLGAGGC
jgi:hypothetical protein